MNYSHKVRLILHIRAAARNTYAGYNVPWIKKQERYDDPENIS